MNLSLRNLADQSVTPDDLAACGVSQDADALCERIAQCMLAESPAARWAQLVKNVLTPTQPFPLHRWLFDCVYQTQEANQEPPAAWFPTKQQIDRANVTVLGRSVGLDSYDALCRWATEHRSEFWLEVLRELDVQFAEPPKQMWNGSQWLEGARLNIVDSCFQASPDKPAIICRNESGETRETTYGELLALVNRVANGLREAGFQPGDRLGIMLPMNTECIAAYLGMIKAGCVPVSIAESFAPKEIEVRLRLSAARGIFVADVIHRGGKKLPCFDKFLALKSDVLAIVIPAREECEVDFNRSQVKLWDDFLSENTDCDSVFCNPDAESNILFSSGTTGEPKAIPWTHITPLKCAADGRYHQNIHASSVTAWPTSLGWMMGPWLVYATLLNKATMALYDGAANSQGFCQFIQDAKVSMLGVIPSLIPIWRSRGMLEGLDWSAMESFSSTGECSNADDMLYLMSRAGYRPMVEYCGGTELGGGYIAGTVVQPCVPGCFSTVALGLDLVLLSEGEPANPGEVFLIGPTIGFSERLLNADHDAVYYAGTPELDGLPRLRRHGDELIRFANGYYQACGRTDDAMNLGGIKVSAVEIERCLNQLDFVSESVAIAVPGPAGGPSELAVFVVVEGEAPEEDALKSTMQKLLSREMNPLYRISQVRVIERLPRTPSNKIMRRKLRNLVG